MEEHYRIILADSDKRLVYFIQEQVLDKNSPYYGAFIDRRGVSEAKVTLYRLETIIACYLCSDSKYYKNKNVYERILAGLKYVKSVQHENGLFDYVSCNFNSAPDTAFCLVAIVPPYQVLREMPDRTPEEETIYKELGEIIYNGAKGIMVGGFHTPNHRWAIAGMLKLCGRFFDDDKMYASADRYLAEGIDCNEDGEYAEKSAGNYNSVNNDAMIMLSEATGDPSFEDHVCRNLEMMLTYWEPNGSIFTANSTRFDKDLIVYPLAYYTEYMLMAVKRNNDTFYQMCNTIMDIVRDRDLEAPDVLIYFLKYPQWRKTEFEGSFDNPDYRVFYKNSNIARVRNKDYTYTVMGGKSDFLYFHVGTMQLAMKVAGSFCEHRAFISEEMKEENGVFHLHQTMKGWYYLPWTDEKRPDTSNWWAMDNASRDKLHGPDIDIDVFISDAKSGDGLDVRVVTSSDAVKGAPWRVELAFTGGDFLENEHLATTLTGSETITIKDGYTAVSNARDTITVGPGFGAHHFMEGKEDSELTTAGASTIYFTDYTPFDRTILIRNGRSSFADL